jgi:hypothetical protein
VSTITLLSNATTAGQTGTAQNIQTLRIVQDNRTFQATGQTTSGTGTATVNVEVSNDSSNWILMGSITLTLGTTTTSDGFVAQANWTYVRGKIPSAGITGTGASVNLYMGL